MPGHIFLMSFETSQPVSIPAGMNNTRLYKGVATNESGAVEDSGLMNTE